MSDDGEVSWIYYLDDGEVEGGVEVMEVQLPREETCKGWWEVEQECAD